MGIFALAAFTEGCFHVFLCSALARGLTWLWLLQVPDCRVVLLVGLSLMIVPVAVMCCFNDDRSLGDSSEAKRCELGCLLNIRFVYQTPFIRRLPHHPSLLTLLDAPWQLSQVQYRPCTCMQSCKAPV